MELLMATLAVLCIVMIYECFKAKALMKAATTKINVLNKKVNG